jgi:ribosomal-protein-alanine N-acetyltransferase
MMAALPQSIPAALRPMQLDDLAQIAEIETAAYEFPWTRGIFRDCLSAGYNAWVLARGARIIGYGILSVGMQEAHLLNLCIAPSEQGLGHGQRLLKRMLDLARWHEAQRVFLEVRPSNQHAVALYEHTGFNEVGRRPGYYPARRGREDAMVMALELLPSD